MTATRLTAAESMAQLDWYFDPLTIVPGCQLLQSSLSAELTLIHRETGMCIPVEAKSAGLHEACKKMRAALLTARGLDAAVDACWRE